MSMVRVSRNAWDQNGTNNRNLQKGTFGRRQTIRPVRGPQLQPTFDPPAAVGSVVELGQTLANVAVDAIVDIREVTLSKTPTGGTIQQVKNNTNQQLLINTFVYVFTHPNTPTKSMFPMEIEPCTQ